MTREEAIAILDISKTCQGVSGRKYDEAIDMAISALSADGDIISRSDAIEAVCDKCPISFKDKCEWKDNGHCSTKEALKALPSADITETETCQRCQDLTDTILNRQGERIKELEASAEAVQGEWIRKYDDKINCYWYECDQCGEYRPRNQFGREYNANFCPNCGAKMKDGGTE